MDQNFDQLDIVENSESVMWKRCFAQPGSFEIYTVASSKYVDLLQMNRYVIRHDDDMIGVIEKINMQQDDDGRDMMLVSGRCAKALFARRIIFPQCTFSGTVWNRMYWMLSNHAINPPQPDRQIPNMTIAYVDTPFRGPAAQTQHTGTNLMTAVCDLLSSNNLGWKVTQDGTQFIITMFEGTDRTIDQEAIAPVIFSDEFDNLVSSNYERDLTGYANVAHIAGEGDGDARIWDAIDATGTQSGRYTGLNRYELYVDARDIEKTTTDDAGNDVNLTDAQYSTALRARGLEKLAEIKPESFEGDVDVGAYTYRVDYNVGDLVTIRDRHGITANTRIESIEECEDKDGLTITPTFSDFTITNLEEAT